MGRWERDPARERRWRERVARWQASGLSVRAFCLQRGLTDPTFYYWKRELRARDQATTEKKSGHGRRKLPADLRRETELVDVPESVQQATGGTWVKIGEEISEKLDNTPSSLFVRRIVRPKYAVRFPDSDQPDELKIAELPPEALPKSKAAPGLVADVIVSKLVDHLPLYRQEQRYARQGFSLARSTLRGWLAGRRTC